MIDSKKHLAKQLRIASPWWCCALVLVLPVIAGCGNGMPMVRVSGQVTFDGSECPSDGRITFKPIEVADGLPSRSATAQFQKDGRYTVTSYKKGDGLLPGRYEVDIMCISGVPNFSDPKGYDKVSYIKPGYKPDELVVEDGAGSMTVDYDVPAKK